MRAEVYVGMWSVAMGFGAGHYHLPSFQGVPGGQTPQKRQVGPVDVNPGSDSFLESTDPPQPHFSPYPHIPIPHLPSAGTAQKRAAAPREPTPSRSPSPSHTLCPALTGAPTSPGSPLSPGTPSIPCVGESGDLGDMWELEMGEA